MARVGMSSASSSSWKNRTVRAKEMSSTAGKVGGGGGVAVGRVQAQLRLNEQASAVVHDKGGKEEVGQGPAQGVGQAAPPAANGWDSRLRSARRWVVWLSCCARIQNSVWERRRRRVGMRRRHRSSRIVSFGGEACVGTQQRRGAVKGGRQVDCPPIEKVQAHQVGQPLCTRKGGPHADVIPSLEDNTLAGGVEDDAPAAVTVAERGVCGEHQAGIPLQDRRVSIDMDWHGVDGGVGEEGDLNRKLPGCSAEVVCLIAKEVGPSHIPCGVERKHGLGAGGFGVRQE